MRRWLIITVALLSVGLIVIGTYSADTDTSGLGSNEQGALDRSRPELSIAARTAGEVSDQMREAFLAGNPVRVEYRAPDGKALDRHYWCRPLTDAETERVLRDVSRVHGTTDRAFELRGSDDVEVEKEMTNQFRIRAMTEAAATLLQEGKAFITKGTVNALLSDDNWHYWNISFHTHAEGDLWVNVPIDLNRFPQVRDWRQREQEMNQFAETEAAYRWNSLDYTVRQQIVADGKAAREQMVLHDQEAKELNAVPRDERTAEQIARSIALGKQMEACRKAIARVPRRLDPDTLEWKF